MGKILINTILRRKRTFILTILLNIISVMLIAITLYIYSDNNYCISKADKVLANGIKGTGVYVINTTMDEQDFDLKAEEFKNKVAEIRGVEGVADFKSAGEILTGVPKLREVQDKYINQELVKDMKRDSVYGIITSGNPLSICNAPLQKGEFKESNDKYVVYLYLGNNLSEIPVGTEYHFSAGIGTDHELNVTYIVQGVFEKGAVFIDSRLLTETYDLLSEECAYNLDNMVLAQSSSSMINHFFYTVNGESSVEKVNDEIGELAKETGWPMITASAAEILRRRQEKTMEVSRMVIDLLIIVVFANIIILTCLSVSSILGNKSEYGILQANGYSSLKLSMIIVIENAIKFIIATYLGCFAAKIVISLYGFWDSKSMEYLFNDIFINYVLWKVLIIMAALIVISSVIPVMVIKRMKPVNLIGGNET